jgi:hypothetical protein
LIGIAKTALGRAEEAEDHYCEALRLSPRDVAAHHWMSSAGTSKLHLARDEEAAVWFRRAIEANPQFRIYASVARRGIGASRQDRHGACCR